MIGVIAAAGRGTRAYPHTRLIPKAMLDVCGQPVLAYTLAILRDQMGIEDVVIVIGRHGESIRQHFGDGSAHGVRIRYVMNDRVDLGLAHSVRLAREHAGGEHFVLMLSDELYAKSNHGELVASPWRDAAATLAIRPHSTQREIRKNFTVETDGPLVRALVEKPAASEGGLLGCGTYIFSPAIFEIIERRNGGDLMAAVQDLIAGGAPVRHFALDAEYVNINYQEDIHAARGIVRRERLAGARISLVMPTEDRRAVADMLLQTRRRGGIADVILVARGLDPALTRLAADYNARVVVAEGLSRREYGALFRAGIAEAAGDIVVLTSDDDSFELADLDKLLAYICDADLVLGTRTASQLVQQKSNLRWDARTANWLLAKLIEVLWFRRRVRLTDAACTFRAFWRDTWDQLSPAIASRGPVFAPEMIVEALRRRMWVVEIPINYCRAGDESRVRTEHRHIGVFFAMLAMIARKRLT